VYITKNGGIMGSSNRSRTRNKRRKRKIDAEMSFISILGNVFSADESEIVQDTVESFDLSKDSIPGQTEFEKKQSKLDND